MSTEPNTSPPSPPPPPAPGLPPVTPPSGRFIAQLFLVPGTIVFVAVFLLMMFHNLFGGSQTAPEILRRLDDANPDIRWRAASDLANSLERSESQALRCDPQFALELVERLQKAVAEVDAQKPAADGEPTKQQTYVSFLTVAVARLHVPLAIGVLCELAQRPDRPDDLGFVHIRRQALLALSILGDNVQKFPDLSQEQQSKILEGLEEMAHGAALPKAAWASTALFYLGKGRSEPESEMVVRVDRALAVSAHVDDPFARRLTAFALRFWKSEPSEWTFFQVSYDLVEATLIDLSHDDGHGKIEAGDGKATH